MGPLVSRCTGCQFDIIIIVIALPTQMSTGSTPYYTHANVYACERVHWPLLMAKWYSSPHQSNNSLIKSGMPDQETSFSLAGCQPMCAHARMCAHTLHTHTHTFMSSLVREAYVLINNDMFIFQKSCFSAFVRVYVWSFQGNLRLQKL